MLKELESMTYEEAGEEFTVFSLSALEKKNPQKQVQRWEGRLNLFTAGNYYKEGSKIVVSCL